MVKKAKPAIYLAAELVTAIYSNKELSKEFGVINDLTEEDHMYLRLWEVIQRGSSYSRRKEVTEVRDWLATIAPAPEILALKARLNSPWIEYLNASEFRRTFQSSEITDFSKLVTILNVFLNP